jgi:hypothetical protein
MPSTITRHRQLSPYTLTAPQNGTFGLLERIAAP